MKIHVLAPGKSREEKAVLCEVDSDHLIADGATPEGYCRVAVLDHNSPNLMSYYNAPIAHLIPLKNRTDDIQALQTRAEQNRQLLEQQRQLQQIEQRQQLLAAEQQRLLGQQQWLQQQVEQRIAEQKYAAIYQTGSVVNGNAGDLMLDHGNETDNLLLDVKKTPAAPLLSEPVGAGLGLLFSFLKSQRNNAGYNPTSRSQEVAEDQDIAMTTDYLSPRHD
jgi:exonuclease VII large subunit